MRYFLGLAILAAVVLGGLYLYNQNINKIDLAGSPRVAIGSTNIPVEIADTEAEREKGLSGRKSLDPNKGLLFIFPEAGFYNFWMPDMHFPIDIIWINDNKVIDISANVSNEFDPNNPVLYRPISPAKYVLETNAGFAENKEIRIGDDVVLPGDR